MSFHRSHAIIVITMIVIVIIIINIIIIGPSIRSYLRSSPANW